MTMLSPWWLLLFPALYLVIILHTLHPQRNRVLVPSILLWQRVLKELAADARWRQIVANLLLLAQLLALAFLITALARPAFLISASRQRHDVILLDTSASMAATDIAPNRLQRAKELVWQHLRTDRPRRVTLINAGPIPAILYDGSASGIAVRTILQRLTASDGSTDWKRAAVLAHSSLTSSRDQVIIASDGAIDAAEIRAATDVIGKTPIRLLRAAGAGTNVGITAFEARQAGDSSTEYELMITLANYSAARVEAPLVLRGKKGDIARRTVVLPPGEKRSVVIKHSLQNQDVLVAGIEYADHLAVDNQAYLAAYPPTPTRVLLVGPSNYYLEKVLRVFPQVRLERRLLYPEGSDYPLVIFDRIPVPDGFTGTALYLAGAPADHALGTRSAPQITWWDRSHPLTRFVNWNDLGLQQTYLMPRLEGAQVLVESEAGPLLQLVQDDKKRLLVSAFSLEDSDLPFKVAFPLFISHLLEWAHPEGWQYIRPPYSPGQSLELPLSFQTPKGWQIRRPNGDMVQVDRAEASYADTLQAGLYTVVSGDNEFAFAVNAGNAGESDIRPRLSLPAATGTADQYRQIPIAFWWPFALLALMLLFAEGWLYTHKVRHPTNMALPSWTTVVALFRRVVPRRG